MSRKSGFLFFTLIGCLSLNISAQSNSAIEFYDTTATEPTAEIGWSGSAEDGHFFILTPNSTDPITIKNGNMEVTGSVTSTKFIGDGSGLTNLPHLSENTDGSIENAFIRADSLILVLSNGDSLNAGFIRGPEGDTGPEGASVEKVFIVSDSLYLTKTNGDTINAGYVRGPIGEPGTGGASVTDALIKNDSLHLALSNGDTINAGFVRGPTGIRGPIGTSIDSAYVMRDSLYCVFANDNEINAGHVKGPKGDTGGNSILNDSSGHAVLPTDYLLEVRNNATFGDSVKITRNEGNEWSGTLDIGGLFLSGSGTEGNGYEIRLGNLSKLSASSGAGSSHANFNMGTQVSLHTEDYAYRSGADFSLNATETNLKLSDDETVFIEMSGTADTTFLRVNGNIFAPNVSTISDLRLKRNITEITDALGKVMNIRGVNHYWRTEEYPEKGFSDKQAIGFIAQEIEPILPELIQEDQAGYKTIAYDKLTAVLVEAIKDQQEIISSQQERIYSQTQDIRHLQKDLSKVLERLEDIENKLGN